MPAKAVQYRGLFRGLGDKHGRAGRPESPTPSAPVATSLGWHGWPTVAEGRPARLPSLRPRLASWVSLRLPDPRPPPHPGDSLGPNASLRV